MTNVAKTNLLNFDRSAMRDYFLALGESRFRADQVLQWIHQHGIQEFAEMTNLSKSLRARLADTAVVAPPAILQEHIADCGTIKWQIGLGCQNSVETVFIPEDDRGTLCVSSQVGCALNCSFCATGKQGFNRNLSVAEIIGQVWLAVRRLSKQGGGHDHRVTNVVMMGMGEPLLNFDNVVRAMNLMLDDFAYGLSKRRVTLSTAGVIPAMLRLKAVSNVALAVSLHAPNDPLRDILVPLNKKYPIAELLSVCKNYFANEPRRQVTFEYVMLHEVNDHPEHAHQLVQLLRDIPAKVNLIPFNPIEWADYRCSSPERIDTFRQLLLNANINTITRKTRGDKINAACGQLVGQVQDKSSRAARIRRHYAAQYRNAV